MVQVAFGYFYSIIFVEVQNSNIHLNPGFKGKNEQNNVSEEQNRKHADFYLA